MKIDLLIVGANEVITVTGHSGTPKTKEELNDIAIIEQGAIAVADGKIIACGTIDEVMASGEVTPETETINAKGMIVLPGFVDPHTHLVFAGSRENELQMRLEGAAYLDILESGGGILSTVRQTREASIDELIDQSKSDSTNFFFMA